MRRIVVFTLFLTLGLCGSAFALTLIGQDPIFDTYVIKVEEPVTLVFDASLDPATATPANVYLTRADTSDVVAASVDVTQTDLANDTVVITPNEDLRFGKRYRITIETALTDSVGTPYSGAYPFGRDFVPNIPRDMVFPDCPYNDTDCMMDLTNVYMGFNPVDPENTDPTKFYEIPGVSATEAWKWATGRPDVIIGVVDDGMTDYTDPDLRDRLFLNQGELPMPQIGDAPCGDYDCNGDGRFSASDYAEDERVLAVAGASPVNVGHLLQVFSDDVDSDGNGLTDDISGWDFYRNSNEVLGVDAFPEGTHGDGADGAVGAAQNGSGNKIGFCPDCTVLEVRVSDAVMADFNLIAAGVDYAHEMGAKVISIAMGSMNFSEDAHQAVLDAYDDGVLTIAAGGDEMGFHHLWPACGEDVLNVKALFPFAPIDILGFIPIELAAFTESYCTNYGAHTDISVPAGHICTSEATYNTSGTAALIVSRARDVGIELSANELKQIINMSANDIYERCISLVEGPSMGGVCRRGFDQHFGYGRMNAKRAFDMLGYPELGIDPAIPPEARITSPAWWKVFDPAATPVIDVYGQMKSRAGSYRWELQGARGVQPYDWQFETLASGSESGPVDGLIASVDITGLMPEEHWSVPPNDANDKTVTLRLQVTYQSGGNTILGEARKALQLQRDDDPETGLIPSFPIEIGASVESSPRLYDMDGDADGRLEIVFATSLGSVEMYKYDEGSGTWMSAPGFPVDVSGESPRYADGILGSTAIADLDLDGYPEIVAVTLGGVVYAIRHDGNLNEDGPFLDGFPVAVDEPPNETTSAYGHGNSVISSPALADLDLDGYPEIIVGSYDQKAYAWKITDEDDDGAADLLAGWPVLLRSSPGVVPPALECGESSLPAQVLGSPAVGILDPNNPNTDISEHPAVVVAVTETCEENSLLPTGRVYAVYWNGNNNSEGPYLPGWPAAPLAPLGDAIPVPPLTTGETNSPAIWIDDEGIAHISTGGFLWLPQMIIYNGEKVSIAAYGGNVNATTTANGTFAHFRGDDSMQFLIPTVGLLNNVNDKIKLESWNVVGFDVNNYDNLIFRQRWEDVQFFVNPIVADISGDNLPEVIAGSAGHIMHAFDMQEREPEGWPKATHNWTIASAAVGDLDRDGKLEVVQPMHEGRVFAWETTGKECRRGQANSDWWTFHHDERGTGLYGLDTRPPAMIVDLDVTDNGDGTFTLVFPATGDDLGCGTVASYDVRYSTNSGDDLRPLPAFLAATQATVTTTDFTYGGNRQTLTVEAPAGAVAFAVRAADNAGLLSWPSVTSIAHDPEPTDDDDTSPSDDDDTEPTDDAATGDDDDDDGGCCG